jgi:hypothetical protein
LRLAQAETQTNWLSFPLGPIPLGPGHLASPQIAFLLTLLLQRLELRLLSRSQDCHDLAGNRDVIAGTMLKPFLVRSQPH